MFSSIKKYIFLIALMFQLLAIAAQEGTVSAKKSTSDKIKDSKTQKIVDQFILTSNQKKSFSERISLFKTLQKKISERVDELVPNDESSDKANDKNKLQSDEVVSLNALVAIIDLKSEKSCDADMARIKNAEPPFVDEKTGQKDYTTGTSARLALKILSAVCNKK